MPWETRPRLWWIARSTGRGTSPRPLTVGRPHRLETEGEILRLETLPDGFEEEPSGLKDAALSLGGDLAAMSHGLAEAEVLKKAFATSTFETFEAASCRALVLPASLGFNFYINRMMTSSSCTTRS